MSMLKIPMSDVEIKGLEVHMLPTKEHSQLSDAFRCGFKFANDNAKREWISVDDRLPTKSKCGVLSDNVLTFNFGKVDILCFFHEESRFTRHGCDTQKPTHWMPLPAPPKQ